LKLVEGAFSKVRNLEDALYPNRQPCRFESSATQIHSRVDAKHPELKFRALLTEGGSEIEVGLV
jgi:hypothetical protein